jgi:hypothetical protein
MNSFKPVFQEFYHTYLETEKLIFFYRFSSVLLYKMDENKYRNIYNAMNDNYSYQTYYINSISNNSHNSTITQQQFYSIKDDLIKYMNK